MKPLLILSTALSLQACMSLDLKGQLVNTDETFSGSVTEDWNGGGRLSLISSKGASCEGAIDYFSYLEGQGDLTCTDNRHGFFKLKTDRTNGSGYGSLDNKPLTFTFGF